jgi:hypothetical protein
MDDFIVGSDEEREEYEETLRAIENAKEKRRLVIESVHLIALRLLICYDIDFLSLPPLHLPKACCELQLCGLLFVNCC